MFTSFYLANDATVRLGDYICTEGAFDFQQQRYREVLRTSATVGLRALRDRRMIALRQGSQTSSGGGNSSGSSNRVAAAQAAMEMGGANPDDIPISPSFLRFHSGPSSGAYKKRAPSRVPSKNRDELERISKMLSSMGGGDGDEDDEDQQPDDDAALLRRAMAEAKKKQKQQLQAQAAQIAILNSIHGNTSENKNNNGNSNNSNTSGLAASFHSSLYSSQQQQESEREKQFIGMVDEALPKLLGTSSVRLFGVVVGVDAHNATVQVWRKGGSIFTEKRPLEKLPLNSLQKLSSREFTLCCTKPLVQYADGRTRKISTGAVTIEDMPATLMAHTNEIVESLIQKMEQTAAVQRQAVIEELQTLHENNNKRKKSSSHHLHLTRKQQHQKQQQQQNFAPSASMVSSSFLHASKNFSPSSSLPHHGQSEYSASQMMSQNRGAKYFSSSSASSASSQIGDSNVIRRDQAQTPQPRELTFASSGGGGEDNKHNLTPERIAHFGDLLGLKRGGGREKLKIGTNRHQMRGMSLKNRHNLQAHSSLTADSPLLEKYQHGTKCGVHVVRSLPEPPVTRLIDPLVDVREEFRALSVMDTGKGAYKPQSQYILSMQRADGTSAASSGSGGGDKNKSRVEEDATVPVLGSLSPSHPHSHSHHYGDKSTTTSEDHHGSKKSKKRILTSAESSQMKIPPASPSFIETAVSGMRPTHSAAISESLQASGIYSSTSSLPLSVASRPSQKQQQQKQRKIQPMPPVLLYSSYEADAELLPPEIPCSVLEYRPQTKCLVLNVRRVANFGMSTSPGSSPQSTARGNTGRKNTTNTNNSARNEKRPSSATSNQQPQQQQQQHRLSEAAQNLQVKWQQAYNGLSTIMIQCAFVDILTEPEQQEEEDEENINENDDVTSLPPSEHPSSSHNIAASASSSRSPQQQQHQTRGTGAASSSSVLSVPHTTGSGSLHSHSSPLGGKPKGSSASSGTAHAPIINDGDSYLASLVGKQIDIVPLWYQCIDNEHVCICDVQRGDLSILEEMIGSGYAQLSKRAIKEFDDLREQFQSQLQQLQQEAGEEHTVSSPQLSKMFASSTSSSAFGSFHASPKDATLTMPSSTSQQKEKGGSSNDLLSSPSSSMLSPTNRAPSFFTKPRPGSASEAASSSPLSTQQQQKPQIISPVFSDSINSKSDNDTDAAGTDSNENSLQHLKSRYFAPANVQKVFDEHPEIIINAAEAFLGRRVFRLLETESTSHAKLPLPASPTSPVTSNYSPPPSQFKSLPPNEFALSSPNTIPLLKEQTESEYHKQELSL